MLKRFFGLILWPYFVNKLKEKIMKKILLTLTSVLALSGAYAQTDENTKDVNANASDYNRWSIEVAGGVNKFQRPASADHYQTTPSFYNAD